MLLPCSFFRLIELFNVTNASTTKLLLFFLKNAKKFGSVARRALNGGKKKRGWPNFAGNSILLVSLIFFQGFADLSLDCRNFICPTNQSLAMSPTGIFNQGNTRYLNSVLQALLLVKDYSEGLYGLQHRKCATSRRSNKNIQCCYCM